MVLAPHGKTTMAPGLYQRQLKAGAWGITVASPAQARVALGVGAPRILIANEVTDTAGIRWLGAIRRDHPKVGLFCYVDSLAQRAAGDVAEGGDPGARKQAERSAAKDAASRKDELVENVVDDFVKLHAQKRTRDWRETERILKKDVVTAWRGRRLPEIEKKHVVKLLDTIVDAAPPWAQTACSRSFEKCALGQFHGASLLRAPARASRRHRRR